MTVSHRHLEFFPQEKCSAAGGGPLILSTGVYTCLCCLTCCCHLAAPSRGVSTTPQLLQPQPPIGGGLVCWAVTPWVCQTLSTEALTELRLWQGRQQALGCKAGAETSPTQLWTRWAPASPVTCAFSSGHSLWSFLGMVKLYPPRCSWGGRDPIHYSQTC